jgi:hypothetical protein
MHENQEEVLYIEVDPATDKPEVLLLNTQKKKRVEELAQSKLVKNLSAVVGHDMAYEFTASAVAASDRSPLLTMMFSPAVVFRIYDPVFSTNLGNAIELLEAAMAKGLPKSVQLTRHNNFVIALPEAMVNREEQVKVIKRTLGTLREKYSPLLFSLYVIQQCGSTTVFQNVPLDEPLDSVEIAWNNALTEAAAPSGFLN